MWAVGFWRGFELLHTESTHTSGSSAIAYLY